MASTGRQQGDAAPDHPRDYVPGMGRHRLLALYDPLVRCLGKGAVDAELVRRAGLRSGHRVLDLGCGTGTVTLRAARSAPGAEVHGLDPDPRALDRGRRKAARAGVPVVWDRGFGQELPYPDGHFDRILCSFVLHHLDPQDRVGALAEARRVLAPGGSLHLVDLDGHDHVGHDGDGHDGDDDRDGGRGGHRHGLRLHGARLHSADAGAIGAQLRQAGFAHVEQEGHRSVPLLGRATFFRAGQVSGGPW